MEVKSRERWERVEEVRVLWLRMSKVRKVRLQRWVARVRSKGVILPVGVWMAEGSRGWAFMALGV